MLARLEREKLLAKDSEIKNLGLIMALLMDVASGVDQYGLLRNDDKEALGAAKDKLRWIPDDFDNYILAYARKYDIPLVGPGNIPKVVAEADGDVALPDPTAGKGDPFGFKKALKAYKSERGGISAFMARTGSGRKGIGGDTLDITAWSSAKRKQHAFEKKDPLKKDEIENLKKGLVLSFS